MLIRVPCSTANIGPGFDSLGIALSIYLTVEFYENDCNLLLANDPTIPLDFNSNLITRTALDLCASKHATLPSLRISIYNDIPLARGLGSSGSAIVAGCILANSAARLNLSQQDIINYCTSVEGHPDNVTPSILGGLVSSFVSESTTFSIKMTPCSAIKVLAFIPDYQVKTSDARAVLPAYYKLQDVVYNSSRIFALVHELCSDNPRQNVIKHAICDAIHQQYRQKLVPGLEKLLTLELPGLLGVYLSGAGPTVIAFALHNFDLIQSTIQDNFPSSPMLLEFDNQGATLNE
jgi:homoserine kinase